MLNISVDVIVLDNYFLYISWSFFSVYLNVRRWIAISFRDKVILTIEIFTYARRKSAKCVLIQKGRQKGRMPNLYLHKKEECQIFTYTRRKIAIIMCTYTRRKDAKFLLIPKGRMPICYLYKKEESHNYVYLYKKEVCQIFTYTKRKNAKLLLIQEGRMPNVYLYKKEGCQMCTCTALKNAKYVLNLSMRFTLHPLYK